MINEMTMAEIEARELEIKAEASNEDIEEARSNELVAELEELEARKAEIKAEAEKRSLEAEAIAQGSGTVKEEIILEERKMFGIETKEYRDAFYAMLTGNETAEQRDIVVDTTNPGGGDAIAIPKSLDTKIWDNIHTAHPILADIATVRSGMAIEVTKHTAIAARTQKKLDSANTPDQEANTFVKVVLYGYDYEKWVQLTYAEAKMSAGALEDYLAQEISAELGEALAKDVFAQILTDCGTAQKVTPGEGATMFDNVKAALALAIGGGKKVIYAPASAYYNIIGAVGSGSPYNIAATLGCEVKLDNAATKVTVLDPSLFILNEVQGITIESDKDVKAHKVIISGYLRAQGCLRNVKAAAYIN